MLTRAKRKVRDHLLPADVRVASEVVEWQKLSEALLRGTAYWGPIYGSMCGDWTRHRLFPQLVSCVATDSSTLRLLEVGSWAGGSTVAWARALAGAGREFTIDVVDAWEPHFSPLTPGFEEHHSIMNHAAQSELIFPLFMHNISVSGLADVVDVIRGRSEQVLPTLQPAAYDIVFVDGSHEYHVVAQDLQSCLHLVKPGGLIVIDDLELQEFETNGPPLSSADWSEDPSGTWYHPGVTRAVGETLGRIGRVGGLGFVRVASGGTREIPELQGGPDLAPLNPYAAPESARPHAIAVNIPPWLWDVYRKFFGGSRGSV